MEKPTSIENPAFDPNDDDSLASPSFIQTQSTKTIFVDKSPSTPKKNRRRCLCTPTDWEMSVYEIVMIVLTVVALVIGVSLAIRFTVFYNSHSSLTDDVVGVNDVKGKTQVDSVIKRHVMIPPPPVPPCAPCRLRGSYDE
ncbi:uncharacterized protein LOC117100535 isoform X1 [Anneissia japonica]|uniref:uncharacterized protein LOC117100535 isoform X1 n=1 Tax=Anneissia japonica TaxID=1529436 RepID=UPI0014257F8E|nr:uncharacterized protein LOC117100535 isoform X1 [Anneissia japonica]